MENKPVVHELNSKFFFYEEDEKQIVWRTARFSSEVSNAAALQRLRQEAYYLADVDEHGKRTYVPVSIMLGTARAKYVETEMRQHMGI